jgi:hypothetical protein
VPLAILPLIFDNLRVQCSEPREAAVALSLVRNRHDATKALTVARFSMLARFAGGRKIAV